MEKTYDKIYGCLLGAAIGDAMGSPPETRPVYLVREDCANGGWIDDYLTPLPDSIARGFRAGEVTDDFSCAYMGAKQFLRDGGIITHQGVVDALIEWKNNPDTKKFFDRFGGPTTRKGIEILEGKRPPDEEDPVLAVAKTATNGGGMKSWIIGLFDPNDLDKAIDDALTFSIVTHNNPIALSGAGAVAAAVSRGMMKDATIDHVIEAGFYGAREGYRKGWQIARPSAGASMERRMDLAVEIGMKYGHDFEKCVVEMTDLVGTGLAANESVAAAFGYLAAGGDAMRSILMAVNSGNDSDTTAIMTGAMAGVVSGGKFFDPHHKEILERENSFLNFEKFAREIYDTIYK